MRLDFCLRVAKNSATIFNMNNLELMRLNDNDGEDAFEQEDFEQNPKSAKERYDEFYDDVKQPSRFIKEDW